MILRLKLRATSNQSVLKLNRTGVGGVGCTGDTYVLCQRGPLSKWTALPEQLVPQTLVSRRARRHDAKGCCCMQASPFHFTGSFESVQGPSREQEVAHRAAHISFFRVLLLHGSKVVLKGPYFINLSLCVSSPTISQ